MLVYQRVTIDPITSWNILVPQNNLRAEKSLPELRLCQGARSLLVDLCFFVGKKSEGENWKLLSFEKHVHVAIESFSCCLGEIF